MRKNLIAMSVATLVSGLGLVGGAHANAIADTAIAGDTAAEFSGQFATQATTQDVVAGGIGHQLIIPYFNVQNSNATLINLVNTDAINGKAVKVRFRGAANSDDVYDFQVFLSPGDVWTATISKANSGKAQLTTSDKSCTLPTSVNGEFVTARVNPSLTGDNLAAQTREGYVEIFNMADIPPTIDPATGAVTGKPANALYTAIKHAAGTPLCTPATMNTLTANPTTPAEAWALGLRAPTGTLFANWTIINVPKSGAASGEAPALVANTAPGAVAARGNIVFFPQTGASAAAIVDLSTADPSLRTAAPAAPDNVTQGDLANTTTTVPLPVVAASMFDLPDQSTPYATAPGTVTAPRTQANLLTAALATTAVINEYITDPQIVAFTDWVFSMPTRRYAVALDYRPLVASPTGPAVRVFTRSPARDYFMATNTSVRGGQICTTTAGVTYWNREEGTATGTSFVISPNPPVAAFALCGEASVLTFNAPGGASVLGAEIARTDFPTGTFTDGWARTGTPGLTTGTVGPLATGNGLPILGKSFARASNPAVALGISANFGASWEHRYVRP